MLGKPRKRWGFACLAAGAVLVVDPLATLAATPSSATNVGTSAVTVGLPAATVTDPTGVARNVALGTVIAQSESTPQLLSSIALSGTNLLGHAVPGPSYTTSSGPQSGSYDVPVPTGLPVTGAVNLAHFQLSALGGATSSALSALTGQVGVSPLNLTSSLGQHGITTQVTPTTSTSAASFVISALSLKLSDILPAAVLNGLPLGAVLSLVQQLNLPVGSLAPVISALNQLQSTLQSLDTNLTDLANAQTQLTSLSSSAIQTAEATVTSDTQELAQLQSTLTSDQNAVTAAQSAVTADQTALAAANQTLASAESAAAACVGVISTVCDQVNAALVAAQDTVTSDTNQLNTDEATLASAQSALTSLQTQIANAQQQLTADQAVLTNLLASAGPAVQQAADLVNTLTSTVNGLLTQLEGLLNQLQGTNLTTLLNGLTSTIGNTGLVDLGPITSALSSSADASSATASATCSPSSLSVLGVSVPVPSCAAVDQGLGTLTTKLGAVLKLLPVNVPQLQVSGLQTASQATPKPAADGTTSASAGLTALHLSLPQMKLSALADQLTQNLQQQVQQLLTSLGGSGATSAASVRSAALPSVLSLPGVTVPAGVTSLLSTVLTQLNALPTGQALQGLSTVGLDLTGAAIGATATFKGAGSTSGSPIGTSTSGTPAAGPSPATPAPTGSLPLTGANPVGILASGLLLLVIGYYLLVLADWRRPAAIPALAQERGQG